MKFHHAIAILFVLSFGSRAWCQVPEYTPEEALSMLDQRIRSVLGFKAPGQSQTDPPTWLSLTYVGLEVPKDDKRLVDLIAVQCPPATNELTTYSTAHRLDEVYEVILKNSSLSKPTVQIQGVEEAKKLLVDSNSDSGLSKKYEQYRSWQNKYLSAAQLFDEAKGRNDSAAQNAAQTQMNLILKDWRLLGHKTEMEAAEEKLWAADANSSLTNAQWREQLLSAYRNIASDAQQGTTTANSIAIPRSFLHPSPESWSGDAGWTKVKFDKSDEWSRTEDEYRKSTRYANAGGGFLFWRARASGEREEVYTEHREVKKASQIGYEFEIRRAVIYRPWFDQRFFFNPGFWTWRRPRTVQETAPLPRVSIGPENGFPPLTNPQPKYVDDNVDVPIIPSEVIVARRLKLRATVSTDDYRKIDEQRKSSASVSGRGFFFFSLRGGAGGSNESKLTEVETKNGRTTFEMSAEGPIVIGYISNVVPKAPNPSMDGREWPTEAWGANR
jgi:hypothetical protein